MERHCGTCLQPAGVSSGGRERQENRQAFEGPHHQALIVGAMAETLGHQLRELLTIIEGNLGLAVEDLAPGHYARDSLERARAASSLLGSLVSPIFSFLCIREPRPAPVSVHRHLASWAALLERLLRHEQRLTVVLAPELWTVEVDPVLVEQVLVSLIVGVSRALPEGSTILICGSNLTLEGQGAAGGLAGEYVRLSIEATGDLAAVDVGLDHVASLAACQSLLAQQGAALLGEASAERALRLHLFLPRCPAY